MTFKIADRGKRGDEPRSKFATRKPCVACPEQLERGECSGLPARAVAQTQERNPVVRGLPEADQVLFEIDRRPPRIDAQVLSDDLGGVITRRTGDVATRVTGRAAQIESFNGCPVL